jgi:hypothetical protein
MNAFIELLEESERDQTRELYNNFSNSDKSKINNLIESIKKYDINKLMRLIQPLWKKSHSKPHSVTKLETIKLMVGLTEYKSRGLDMEYWTSGAGVARRNKCTIL